MTTVPMATRLREWVTSLTRPTRPPPRLTRHGQILDVLMALTVGLGSVYYVLDNMTGILGDGNRTVHVGEWLGPVIVAVLASAPLAFRRRYPLAVLWIVLAAVIATPSDAPRLTFYACVIAAYSAAAYSPHRVPTLASLVAAVLLVGTDPTLPAVPTQYAPYLILVPIIVAAGGLREWKIRIDEGRQRLSTLEREQAETLRRAVEHERARIARDLHDVVTHNVSVMVIQAGAARKVMAAHPGQAREALLAVEAGGRAAMTELRHVMGLLATNTNTTGLAPQPSLAHLETLVARVRDTGTPVTLTVAGEPRPLPSGIELAGYRVVQEALTNAVKHAAGAARDRHRRLRR